MIQTIRNAWSVPELRKKILFTIFALLIFRLGSAIPVPYINSEQLGFYLEAQSGTILGLMNAMSGSAFSMATVFALSIQPYINSSIIIQLLTVAIPALERLAKEGGEEGRKKIASITRYTTVAIGLIHDFFIADGSPRRPLQNEGIRLISHCTRHLYRAGKWMLPIEVQAGQIQRKREGERSPGNMKNRTEIQSHGTPHTMAQQTL